MKILVVEDDFDLATGIRVALQTQGMEVVWVRRIEDARRILDGEGCDLLLLDLGLPDGDGVSLIRDVRGWSAVPIIVLSARSDEADKIAALDAGADDYLTKPFAFDELLARVRALLRRPESMRPVILSLADLSLDPQRQRAQRGGATLDLTHKEFAILHMLLRHAGEVVSRARLAEQVWKDDLIGIDNLIDVHVGNLRRKVDAAPAPPLIRTVRGRGFRLAADDGHA